MTTSREDADLARQMSEATRSTTLDDPDADLGRVEWTVNKIVEVVGVVIFAFIVAIVFLNASGRYALGFTFIWGDEIVLSLLPWLGMTGMFLAIRRRQVIRIEYFVGLFPKSVSHVLGVSASLFSAAIFTWLGLISVRYVGMFGGDQLLYLPIAEVWFMSAMVIGPLLAAVAYLVVAYRDFLRGQLSDDVTATEPGEGASR